MYPFSTAFGCLPFFRLYALLLTVPISQHISFHLYCCPSFNLYWLILQIIYISGGSNAVSVYHSASEYTSLVGSLHQSVYFHLWFNKCFNTYLLSTLVFNLFFIITLNSNVVFHFDRVQIQLFILFNLWLFSILSCSWIAV